MTPVQWQGARARKRARQHVEVCHAWGAWVRAGAAAAAQAVCGVRSARARQQCAVWQEKRQWCVGRQGCA